MSKIVRVTSVCILTSMFLSCTPSAFITDPVSAKRQHQMQVSRTGLGFAQVGLVFAAAAGEALTGVYLYPDFQMSTYKKMKLLNKSADTLYVNMLTDWHWKDSTYCDIREIYIPPLQSARLIVPTGAAYNIFFRTNFNAPDDEKIEINTAQISRIKLKPGKEKSLDQSTN